MRMAILLAALLLGACAHKPELAGTPAPRAVKVEKASVVQPEAKPTFKQRWFDRFMKHKTK